MYTYHWKREVKVQNLDWETKSDTNFCPSLQDQGRGPILIIPSEVLIKLIKNKYVGHSSE